MVEIPGMDEIVSSIRRKRGPEKEIWGHQGQGKEEEPLERRIVVRGGDEPEDSDMNPRKRILWREGPEVLLAAKMSSRDCKS